MSKEITSKTKRIANILALAEVDSVSMSALAERFGVSARTIQRDFSLIVQAHIPFISHQQGRLYSYAKGFCLSAVNLFPEQAAVLVISYDIAEQLGNNFGIVQKDIAARFAPPSFDGCDFYPDTSSFSEFLRHNIVSAIEESLSIKVQLKAGMSKVNLKPCKLLCLKNKLYLACLEKTGEITFISVDDISQDYFYLKGKFKRSPFIEWYIWQSAKCYLQELDPKFAVAESDESDRCEQKNEKDTYKTEQSCSAPQNLTDSQTFAEPKEPTSPLDFNGSSDIADEPQAEISPIGIDETPQSKAIINNSFAGEVAEDVSEQVALVKAIENKVEPQVPLEKIGQENTQDGMSEQHTQKPQPAEIKQEILPETPPALDIPEISPYPDALNEELSRFFNDDIDSPLSGVINIGKEFQVNENSLQESISAYHNDEQKDYLQQEQLLKHNNLLSEKDNKDA